MVDQERTHDRQMRTAILEGLLWPVMLGMLACGGFYAAIHAGMIRMPLVVRYFAGDPIEYVETALGFVGLAALLLRGASLSGQAAALRLVQWEPAPTGGQKAEQAHQLLGWLDELPGYARESYLVRRLQSALQYVISKGSGDGLDEELKYLADGDAGQQHAGYALVRIITWATPMLGFLGTVIGITIALGNLSPTSLVKTPEKAMEGLLGGLRIAFDTTALALSLSIFLMFVMFIINRIESEILQAVDNRCTRLLVGRFQQLGTRTDPQLAQVRLMIEAVVDSSQQLVQGQAKLWESALRETGEQWRQQMESTGRQLQGSLGQVQRELWQEHAQVLQQVEWQAQQRTQAFWQQVQQALVDNGQIMRLQQSELTKQGDLLLQAVHAGGGVLQLQQSLSRNLETIQATGDLEDTWTSLATAIQRLNHQLAQASIGLPTPSVPIRPSQGRAA